MRRTAVTSAVLLASISTPLQAQSVRGIVVDQARVPVPGVVVQLVGSTNVPVHRALSNERGEFHVRAPAPGTYRLRTMRIGFRPAMSDAVTLADGEEATRTLALSGVAFFLDTVKVVSRTSCRVPSDTAAATFAIWEQARTALTAATLSAQERSMTSRIVQFDRLYDPSLRRMKHENAAGHSGYKSRAWRALPADSLRAVGYVVTERDGSVSYYGPDIDVMLSDVFMEDHCFRLVDNRTLQHIGIAFEPTRARSRFPEIRGTIWLDRKSAELRTVEFRYTNLPKPLDFGVGGGQIVFARLPNGTWVITRWDIRMPIIERRISSVDPGIPAGRSTSTDQLQVREVRMTGGQLAVVTRGPDTVWAHPPLAVSGRISDLASGQPVAGAQVQVRGTPFVTQSDSSGAFVFGAVLPGSYTLLVARAPDAADSPVEAPFTLVDAPVVVNIRVPSSPGAPSARRSRP